MSITTSTRTALRPTMIGASLGALVLLLAACSTASPAESSEAAESQPAASQAEASEGAASQGAAAGCEATAAAAAAATNLIAGLAFGDEVTVAAGEAVTFTNNDSTAHTVTEGTGGLATSDACVDEPIAAGANVTVTFNDPGDYEITCKIHPSMQTVVHVE